MKALNVRQPWAWAIIHAGKDVENRPKMFTHRGAVAIHAGQRFDVDGGRDPLILRHPDYADADMHFGHVIGVADLVGAHRVEDGCCDSRWAQPWSSVHHELANPRALAEPIPAFGKLYLWDLPRDVFRDVQRQLLGTVAHQPRPAEEVRGG